MSRMTLDEIFAASTITAPTQELMQEIGMKDTRPSLENIFNTEFPQEKPKDGFLSASATHISNIPDNLKSAAGGVMQSLGEVDERQEERNKSVAINKEEDGFWKGAGKYLYNSTARDLGTIFDYSTQKPIQQLANLFTDDLAEKGQAMYNEAQKDIAANQPNVEKGSLTDYGSQAVSAVTETLPALAMSILTKNPTPMLAQTGLTSYGQGYGEQRAAGRTPSESVLPAAGMAVAETATEMLPLGVLMKEGGGLLGRAVKSVVAESAQESVTQAIQDGIRKGTVRPDMTLNEYLENITGAAIVGGMAGGGSGVLASGIHGLKRKPQTEIEAAQPAIGHDKPVALLEGPEQTVITPNNEESGDVIIGQNPIKRLPAPEQIGEFIADNQGNVKPATLNDINHRNDLIRQQDEFVQKQTEIGLTDDVLQAQKQMQETNFKYDIAESKPPQTIVDTGKSPTPKDWRLLDESLFNANPETINDDISLAEHEQSQGITQKREIEQKQQEQQSISENIKYLAENNVKDPDNLLKFIRKRGGIREENGEIKALGINNKTLPALINNKKGLPLDYAREAAVEAGYLPENSTVADFLSAMGDDFRGNKKYSEQDSDIVEQMNSRNSIIEQLERTGVNVNDEVKKHKQFKNKAGKLYSNPFFDPTLWKELGSDVKKVMPEMKMDDFNSWKSEAIKDTRSLVKNFKSGKDFVTDGAKILLLSNDSVLKSYEMKYQSPTIKKIRGMFHAESGKGNSTGQTYHEAINKRVTATSNNISKIFDTVYKLKNSEVAKKRIVEMVQNPEMVHQERNLTYRNTAVKVIKLLNQHKNYLKSSGIEINEIDGYFPRVYDENKILEINSGFVEKATEAYIADGFLASEAKEKATAWLANIKMGSEGVSANGNDFVNLGSPSSSANSLKSRSLGKEADNILRDFMVDDPVDVLQRHVISTTRKAEWEKRFGGKKWNQLKRQLINDGASEVIPSIVKTVASSTGFTVGDPRTKSFFSAIRLVQALAYLPRVTINSISEIAMMGVRTGDMQQLGGGIINTIRALKKDSMIDTKELAEDILGMIADSTEDMMIEQRLMGNTSQSDIQKKISSKFFRANGLHQFTNATKIAAIRSNQFFVKRLARDITSGNKKAKSSSYFLEELGIAKEHHKGLAEWVLGFDNVPLAGDLKKHNQYSEMYQNAIIRATNQTIMQPNAAEMPRYNNTNLGSLAYSLQSFVHGFYKNVLVRDFNLAKEATKKGYTAQDRISFAAPSLMLIFPILIQAGLGELKEEIFKNPDRKKKKETLPSKVLEAVSRTTGFGPLDIVINSLNGARYGRDPVSVLAGPFIGGAANTALGDSINFVSRNSSSTNSSERNLTKSIYNSFALPLMNGAMSLYLPTPVAAAGTQYLSHPATKSKIISAIAGKKKSKSSRSRSRPSRNRNNRNED